MLNCIRSTKFSTLHCGTLFLLLYFLFPTIEDVRCRKLALPWPRLLLGRCKHVFVDYIWITPVGLEAFGVHLLSSTRGTLWSRRLVCDVISRRVHVANILRFWLVSDVCSLDGVGVCTCTSLH